MTREEAFEILEESKRQNEVMRDNPSTFWASHQMAEGVKNAEKRIAALDLALAALRGPTREMVERMRGEWIEDEFAISHCSLCGYEQEEPELIIPFCPLCGSPMTDEAVDMMLEKWKEAVENA